jgi:hypothetical protein
MPKNDKSGPEGSPLAFQLVDKSAYLAAASRPGSVTSADLPSVLAA